MAGLNQGQYDKISSNDDNSTQGHVVQLAESSSQTKLYFLNLLDPGNSEDFWKAVTEKCKQSNACGHGMSQQQSIDEIRADNITEICKKVNKDPVVMMMTEWYDLYEKNVSCRQLYPGFEKQISKLSIIIINREFERVHNYNKSVKEIDDVIRCKYSGEFTISKDPLLKRTILQLAAEGFKSREVCEEETQRRKFFPTVLFKTKSHRSYKRNFLTIAKCILENDPNTWETATDLPLELALKYRDDEMAALLINSMQLKSKIRKLFETRGKDKAKIAFQDIIKDPSMKKTLIAVLDSTVNKDWPYQPAREKDGEDKLHVITDDPVRYHFHYRILDSDMEGRPAKLLARRNEESLPGFELTEKLNYVDNKNFDHRSISCLQALCQSDHKKAINHPTVRSLARRKWELYGKRRIRLYALNYTIFLAFLACSLLLAVVRQDVKKYVTPTDKFRGFCEISTILISCFYLVLEIDQFNKEGFWLYVSDPFNLFDIGGILSILTLIPLRFAAGRSQWILATIAFILNFLRIFKYFPAWKSIGVYSTTLSILIKKDLKTFGVVYFIVLIMFSGATFLSLRGVLDYSAASGFSTVKVSGFDDVLFRGIKALAQSQGFATDYYGYTVFSIVVILTSMFVMMIFLVNILIAQLSASYGKACAEATERYDVDKALFVARLDDSRFRFWNLRMKHYVDGSYEYDKKMIQELMSKWDVLHSSMKKL